MTKYSLAFIQSLDSSRILLIQKNRPAFLAGLYNGVGGHIEDGETPLDAVMRECDEEADLKIPASEWNSLGVISDNEHFEVHVFGAKWDISKALARTDEPLQIFDMSEVHHIPLAPSAKEILQKLGAVWPKPPQP